MACRAAWTSIPWVRPPRLLGSGRGLSCSPRWDAERRTMSRSALCALSQTMRCMQKWAVLHAWRPCAAHSALSGLGRHGRPNCLAPCVQTASGAPVIPGGGRGAGRSRMRLRATGEEFSLVPPNSTAHNVIVGGTWVDCHGDFAVLNATTGAKAALHFTPCGWFGAGRYEARARHASHTRLSGSRASGRSATVVAWLPTWAERV